MILYFKVTNSRSFAKEAIFSMIASEDYPKDYSYQIEKFKIKVLKTALIYGANASGKSNLLKALADANSIIINSHTYSKKTEDNDDNENDKRQTLRYFPNRNELVNENKPTSYTFGIYNDERIFDYSFSVNNERVIHESLIEKQADTVDTVHFIRVYDLVKDEYFYPTLSNAFKEKFDVLIPFTKKENLFLSMAAQLSEDKKYSIETADLVWSFFKNKLQFSISLSTPGKSNWKLAVNLIRENKDFQKLFVELLRKADFSIVDLKVTNTKDELGVDRTTIKTIHRGVNEKQEQILVEYDLLEDESAGTIQFISWLGFWVLASAQHKTLIIDEFGTSMHTMLTDFLIKLFQSNNGQLIFTTHDVKLMNSKLIKKEQIWIVKKDLLSNSSIISLLDFDIPDDKMIDNVYLDGIFNGIPTIID